MTLEEIEKRWLNTLNLSKLVDKSLWSQHLKDIDWLISRVKELEEGIKKHKEICFPNREPGGWWDSQLYKLIEPTDQSSEGKVLPGDKAP